MYLPVIFILVCGLLIIAVFFIRMNILIEYLRNGHDDHLVISFFTLGGLLKLKYEIPLIDLETAGVRIIKFKEKGKTEEDAVKERKRFSFTDLYNKYKTFNAFYSENEVIICKIKKYMSCRVILKEFKINIVAGTGNACLTGILCGLIWTIIGIAVSFLANTFKTFKKTAEVKPEFKEEKLKIDLYCIFVVKIVNIIFVVIKILFDYLNRKLKFKKSIGGGIVG